MTKRTARWRNRRLRLQATQFGYKLAKRLETAREDTSNSDPPSPMSIPAYDASDQITPSPESLGWKREVSAIDVASSLVLFKRRYRVSIACMNYLLRLLPHIHHPSTPTSWWALKSLLQRHSLASPPVISFLCPSCSEASADRLLCSKCGVPIDKSASIMSFKNFSIKDQLHRIVTSNYQHMDLWRTSANEKMKDIRDGEVYRRLEEKCAKPFITLSLNIDGIQPNKGTSKTIWPILLVVNELPQKRRFATENIILAGVWPGPKKPSREHMNSFLQPTVTELVRLEGGDHFFIPSESAPSSNHLTRVPVYLIGACCDKPAQALVQNIAEPIAAFGCGRCEIEGHMVNTGTSDSHVRSFAIDLSVLNEIKQRCNLRYDTLLALKTMRDTQRALLPQRKQNKQAQCDQQKARGIRGPCALRVCSIFDVGYSFMSDSLHNVYSGTFKRMLTLWLSSKHQNEPWSIHNRLDELTDLFKQVRLPSTTTRIPRALTSYTTFKANELRVLLLFGHVIFSNILPKKYYDHLLQLVLLLHLAENRSVPSCNIPIMQKLGENFVVSFSRLYTERHCVQVVHSVVHIAATVHDFGPLSTYTTFNFESQLGIMTRTCHSTRRHAEEIVSNLQLLQCAHHHLNDPTLDPTFKHHLLSIANGKEKKDKNYIYPSRQTLKSDAYAAVLFPQNHLVFFNRLQIGNLTLVTSSAATSTCGDDSTVVFRSQGNPCMGRIQSIFTVGESNTTFLLVTCPTTVEHFVCALDNSNQYKYSSIQSCSKKDLVTRMVQTFDILEKCVYFEHPNGRCFFMRFPSLEHSS